MKSISKMKYRIVAWLLTMVTALTMLPAAPAFAADYSSPYLGGQEIAWTQLTVYDSTSHTNVIGTIYKYEGFTCLLQNGPQGYFWVEYSTSNGPKRGYIFFQPDELGGRNDCVGKVKQTSTVYFGPSTSTYPATGTVYSGEIITVIAKNDDWIFIEYNTNSGRKRGYMSFSNIDTYNRPGIFPDLHTYNKPMIYGMTYHSGTTNVRSGPTSQYPVIGSVSNEFIYVLGQESVYDADNEVWHTSQYIRYKVTGTSQYKTGYLVF